MKESSELISSVFMPLLALVTVCSTFYLFYIFVFPVCASSSTPQSPQKEIIMYILGVLSSLSGQIISYYFGSSKGGRDSVQTLRDIANPKQQAIAKEENK
jgi:hypothetical protein